MTIMNIFSENTTIDENEVYLLSEDQEEKIIIKAQLKELVDEEKSMSEMLEEIKAINVLWIMKKYGKLLLYLKDENPEDSELKNILSALQILMLHGASTGLRYIYYLGYGCIDYKIENDRLRNENKLLKKEIENLKRD